MRQSSSHLSALCPSTPGSAGSTLCPAEHGQLFCFSGGLAFMCSHVSGHALWLCELRRDLEAITLQRLPGKRVQYLTFELHPASYRAGRAVGRGHSICLLFTFQLDFQPTAVILTMWHQHACLVTSRQMLAPTPPPTLIPTGGEDALVLRGKEPACGLPPACHATASKFLALPLNSLSVVSASLI